MERDSKRTRGIVDADLKDFFGPWTMRTSTLVAQRIADASIAPDSGDAQAEAMAKGGSFQRARTRRVSSFTLLSNILLTPFDRRCDGTIPADEVC